MDKKKIDKAAGAAKPGNSAKPDPPLQPLPTPKGAGSAKPKLPPAMRPRRKRRSFFELIQDVLTKDPRYPLEAYRFVFESLDYTLSGLEETRHVSGPELLDGMREYAVEEFGLLALPVFRSWNAAETRDFGHMVFNLVDAGLMGRSEQDTIGDFTDVYDFEQVFDRDVRRQLRAVIRSGSAWPV